MKFWFECELCWDQEGGKEFSLFVSFGQVLDGKSLT